MHPDKAAANRAASLTAGEKRFLGLVCTVDPIAHGERSGSQRYVHSGRCCKCEHERVTKFRAERKRNS